MRVKDNRRGTLADSGQLPIVNLGARARELRRQKGLTLNELAARSGVSRSAISKFELEQISPTYEVIQKLARGLDLSVVEFLGETSKPAPLARRSVSYGGQGELLQAHGYLYHLFCEELATKRMLPFRATILARSLEEAGGYVRHSGEECLFVISGKVSFFTEHYAPATLGAGDVIYIDSNMGHACVSLSSKPAEVFWITVDD